MTLTVRYKRGRGGRGSSRGGRGRGRGRGGSNATHKVSGIKRSVTESKTTDTMNDDDHPESKSKKQKLNSD